MRLFLQRNLRLSWVGIGHFEKKNHLTTYFCFEKAPRPAPYFSFSLVFSLLSLRVVYFANCQDVVFFRNKKDVVAWYLFEVAVGIRYCSLFEAASTLLPRVSTLFPNAISPLFSSYPTLFLLWEQSTHSRYLNSISIAFLNGHFLKKVNANKILK